MDDEDADDYQPDAEFETWHVHDAGGPVLSLKVRYRAKADHRDTEEMHDWQRGPGLLAALRAAEADGWQVYDREPGNAPGEYAIFHLKRDARADPGSD
jgi:hypothetical protein